MKRAVSLLLMVFCSSLLLCGQDTDKKDKKGAGMTEMTGQICRSSCVKTDGGKSSCDANCKDKSGDMVFVDDNGKTWKINNPKSVKKTMMDKPVKAKVKMMSGDVLNIQNLVLANAG